MSDTTTSELLPCPFCGSDPQWRQEQPGGRDGDYELPLRALGCVNRDCFVRPCTEWENRGHFVAKAYGDVRDDPQGLEHIAAWNLRAAPATGKELIEEVLRLREALSWIDTFDPETVAAAENKFGFALIQHSTHEEETK